METKRGSHGVYFIGEERCIGASGRWVGTAFIYRDRSAPMTTCRRLTTRMVNVVVSGPAPEQPAQRRHLGGAGKDQQGHA